LQALLGQTPSIIFVFTINIAHFLFGWFHSDDDISDLAPDEPILMQSAYQAERVYVRILAIFTIGISHYSKHAINAYKYYQKSLKDEKS